MSIARNLNDLKVEIPSEATLIAVSKTYPASDLLQVYEAGHRIFGENKVQELVEKYETLPKDIQWHMIGHLQSNKVKFIAPFISLIHAVDSLKLLQEINRQALKNARVIDCLLQLHIAQEENKFGFDRESLFEMLGSKEFSDLQNIKVTGLMGMASNTDNQLQIKKEFLFLRSVFEELKSQPETSNFQIATLSMGMSNDYLLAIECGSTMVRIGSRIFGKRQ